MKYTKNFSIKDLPRIHYVGFSCVLKGKEPPNIKNLRGQGSLGGEGGGYRESSSCTSAIVL